MADFWRIVAIPLILPTLVLMRDGRAVGVSERAEVVE